MSVAQEDLKKYEIIGIIDPELTEEKTETLLNNFKDFLKKEIKAEIIFEKKLEKKRLAYPIKKQRWGVYFIFNIVAEGEKIHELEEHLRLDQEILRHFVMTIPETYKPDIDFSEGRLMDESLLQKTDTHQETLEMKEDVKAMQKDRQKHINKETVIELVGDKETIETHKAQEDKDDLEQQIQKILNSKI